MALPGEIDLESIRSSLGSPLLVHLVYNRVRGDSRVLKAARTTRLFGISTLILGTTPGEAEYFALEGIPVLLLSTRDMPDVQSESEGQAGPVPSWAEESPELVDLTRFVEAALNDLAPAGIHVHDTSPLPAAVGYSTGAKSAGRRVKVLYDAHEAVVIIAQEHPESDTSRSARRARTAARIEQELIGSADQVMTVSAPISSLMAEHYSLTQRPQVVINAPSKLRDEEGPSLRDVIGLASGIPLAVYSGHLSANRRLDSVVEALVRVPDLHLAIVTIGRSPLQVQLARQARLLGISDRVHFAGYVPPGQITNYLSSADFGICLYADETRFDYSLPTKMYEYVHAGLPFVSSPNATILKAVKSWGVGVAAPADDSRVLARALGRMSKAHDEFAAKIDEELLEKTSWESQEPLLGRIYGRMVGLGPDLTMQVREVVHSQELSSLPNPRHAMTHVGIGPANYASQANEWARSIRIHLGLRASSFGPVSRLSREPDRKWPNVSRMSLPELGRFAGTTIETYSHILVDAFLSPLGGFQGANVRNDIATLRANDIRVGLIAHGSEIRDPDRHRAEYSFSYFNNAPDEWVDRIRAIVHENASIARSFGGPMFVSTPDLLLDLPTAQWLPLVLADPKAWVSPPAFEHSGPVRVMHHPSRAIPPVKGTHYIMPVLETLAAEGLIEVIAPAEHVAPSMMPDLMRSADVVVDQIQTGAYGLTAVEAMASGRLVVGYLGEHVRAQVDVEIPLVDGSPEDFESVMRQIVKDRDASRAMAAQGPHYVEAIHDGRRSAAILESFVKS